MNNASSTEKNIACDSCPWI